MSSPLIRICDIDCNLSIENYVGKRGAKGAFCIKLTAASTKHNDNQDVFFGEPVATATVNDPDYSLSENEVILKSWSENDGLPEVLEKAGVVKFTDRRVLFGHDCIGIVAELQEQYCKLM